MLKIYKSIEGTTARYALEGRLDTLSSPELQQELSSDLNGITDLVFDFAKLKYISSAGMRVLLYALQIMGGKGTLKLINVSPVLQEILKKVGFDEILTIE